jgi:hypothetical protein
MPIERRSRITLLLPAATDLPEFLLVEDVLTELIQLCGGITVSSFGPSAFDGGGSTTQAAPSRMRQGRRQRCGSALFAFGADRPLRSLPGDPVSYRQFGANPDGRNAWGSWRERWR